MSTQKVNDAGKPLPDVGLKWGRTPQLPSDDSSSNSKAEQDWENVYTEEEKQKLRAKGVNPALKAEIDAKRNEDGNGRERGFWGKVAQTAMGGGSVK